MEQTASGEFVSLQAGLFGIMDISTADFSITGNKKFYIKNEGTEAVSLEVIPAAAETDTYVTVKFDPGWNLEIVRKVKTNTGTLPTLLWGY
jgi:hypothetical protein